MAGLADPPGRSRNPAPVQPSTEAGDGRGYSRISGEGKRSRRVHGAAKALSAPRLGEPEGRRDSGAGRA
jgi:hypothetical protein